MCTYNGAKYISKQLESILGQTMRVDEIIVCDDGSTDDTINIIERFQKESSTKIIIHQNASNLGFRENFILSISLCHGDLVLLSDQDDIWCTNKVEVISNWFDKHPYYNVVFTNAYLIDSKGEFLHESLWERFGFDEIKQRYFDHGYALDIWAWCNRATGATMGFRKNYINNINWSESSDAYHDKIIAIHGICNDCLGYIREPLIYYRIHDEQVCGANKVLKKLLFSPLKPCPLAFLDFDCGSLPDREKKHVSFLQTRASFKESRSLFSITKSIPLYFKSYGSWAYKFFLFDLYVTYKHRLKLLLSK